jgi:CBS domain-containing protein
MKISDICTRELVMADKDASLQNAAGLMRQHHVGTLVVVANAAQGVEVVGIVTDRDVVIEAVARGLDARETPISRVAEGKLAVMPGSASVEEAIAAMKKRGVRRLLVANETGQLAGIVSLDDLLDAVAHDMAELARIARAGIERESAERSPLPPSQPPRTVHIPAYSYV